MSVSGVSHKPQGTEGLILLYKLGEPQKKDDKKILQMFKPETC